MKTKFYTFCLLFIVANAFTQSDSGKPLTAFVKPKIDSAKFYKQGMKDNNIFTEARVRIFDRKMEVLDSLTQPSIQYYYMGKGPIGSGSVTVTSSYSSPVNVDSLVNIYDSVKIHTRYGLKIYIR